jgi:hypothetical protein
VSTWTSTRIILSDSDTYTPKAHRRDDGGAPIGSIDLGPQTSIQSNSVEAMLALSDAAQEAARRLRAAQIAGDFEATAAVA